MAVHCGPQLLRSQQQPRLFPPATLPVNLQLLLILISLLVQFSVHAQRSNRLNNNGSYRVRQVRTKTEKKAERVSRRSREHRKSNLWECLCFKGSPAELSQQGVRRILKENDEEASS